METSIYPSNIETRELEKSKEVIGQFIRSCSHSMRGPLKSIAGLVGLLHTSKENSETNNQVFLDLIAKTTLKMEHMLDELEHFMENSNRSLTLKPTNPIEVLEGVLQQFDAETKSLGIKINQIIDQASPLYTDVPRLRLVISKLIENAIQFRDDTKAQTEITISFKVNQNNCTISIADNGIGIDPREKTNIFQLFYRATEKSSGAGIGLYVVREVVEKMGGSVMVCSTPGEGSSFVIDMPNPCRVW
jgi:signal transduction histidine kinase